MSDYRSIQEALLQAQTMQGKAARELGHERRPGAAGWAANIARTRRGDEYADQAQDMLLKAMVGQHDMGIEAAATNRRNKLNDFGAQEAIKAQFRDPSELDRYLQATPEERAKIMEYYQGKRPSTTVNVGDGPKVGTIPPGFQLTKDESGAYRMEMIPGGPADAEAADSERKREGKETMIRRAGATVTQDFGRALDLLPELFQGNNVLSNSARLAKAQIPGTAEYNFQSFIESGKSNIGLDRLQEMRENSPTGGALGQVPFQQQQRLEQVYGQIDLGQDLPIIEENIKRVQNIYFEIMFGTDAERENAVREGRMTPEEADIYKQLFHELSFDITGAPAKDSPGSGDEAVMDWDSL